MLARGVARSETARLEDGWDLDHALLPRHRIGTAPDPLDRFFHRLHLPQPIAGDQLLGLGEGAVNDLPLAARELDALPLRARVQSLTREHDAGLHELLIVVAHVGEELLAREDALFGSLGRLDDNHDSHRSVSFWLCRA